MSEFGSGSRPTPTDRPQGVGRQLGHSGPISGLDLAPVFGHSPIVREPHNHRNRVGLTIPSVVLFGATIAGAGVGTASLRPETTAPSKADTSDFVTNCRVVDGDTLHCDGGRVRLLGIDAPELPGHCAQGRACAPGDPFASTRSLEIGMGDGSRLGIERVGVDRYGRTLGMVSGKGGDLSCWQLDHGAAVYKPAWDNGGRVKATCPDAAR